ncbi:hypothetical protein QJS10_CPA06g02022 [Acorus calamus]|uniref:Uncharacterized protein n=1 Tax=Acorus calamus TaxID=4465 RepID=A0AAV9ETH1_ACOCL|nr:hypothetical protein QJS10_CPA06g02022 [Acorus calamus]
MAELRRCRPARRTRGTVRESCWTERGTVRETSEGSTEKGSTAEEREGSDGGGGRGGGGGGGRRGRRGGRRGSRSGDGGAGDGGGVAGFGGAAVGAPVGAPVGADPGAWAREVPARRDIAAKVTAKKVNRETAILFCFVLLFSRERKREREGLSGYKGGCTERGT